MKEIEALPAPIQLGFKARKLGCDREYYKNFARKRLAWTIIAMIGIFVLVASFGINYTHSTAKELNQAERTLSDEQIRHDSRIDRLEEKHEEVMVKLDGIEDILREIEKSL